MPGEGIDNNTSLPSTWSHALDSMSEDSVKAVEHHYNGEIYHVLTQY